MTIKQVFTDAARALSSAYCSESIVGGGNDY